MKCHAALGLPIAKFLDNVAGYIRAHRDLWLNLSGGTVINIDLSLNFINADRHYPWSGRTRVQRETLDRVDERLLRELVALDAWDKRQLTSWGLKR